MPILPPRDARLEAFIAPARAHPELWRLGLGLLLAAGVWLLAAGGLLFAVSRWSGGAMRPILIVYLASFAALILGLALALRLLHRRDLASLIGPGGIRPRPYLVGAGLVLAIAAVSTLAGAAVDPLGRQVGWGDWANWALLALPAVAVQTAAEEMAFRGYLMQGLAARFRSALVWWLLPGVLFGLLHWDPRSYGPNAWLVVLGVALTGLVLGDVTARLGNLSAAMGLHFANNAVVLLLVAPPSQLDGLSLWTSAIGPEAVGAFRRLILLDIATTLIGYAAWRLWWARRQRLHSEGVENI